MHLKPKKILLFILIFLSAFFTTKSVFADINDDIAAITKQIADLEASMAPLKSESTGLQSKITSAKNQIVSITNQTTTLGQKLIDKESDLEVQKLLLGERVKRYYKNSKKFNSFLIFFANKESSSLFQQYAWYQSIISRDKNTITQYSSEIKILNDNKTKLETEKVKLAKIKKDLETRFGFLATEIKKAETYKAELSAKQQSLIAEKTAMFKLPLVMFRLLMIQLPGLIIILVFLLLLPFFPLVLLTARVCLNTVLMAGLNLVKTMKPF